MAQQQAINNHGKLIQMLVARRTPGLGLGSTSKSTTIASQARDLFPINKSILSEEDPLSEPPLEGGPKTAEFNEDSVVSARLITELDINQELSLEQKKGIRDVVLRNQRAFGLDDKLGLVVVGHCFAWQVTRPICKFLFIVFGSEITLAIIRAFSIVCQSAI